MKRRNWKKSVLFITLLFIPLLNSSSGDLYSHKSNQDTTLTISKEKQIITNTFLLSNGSLIPGNSAFEDSNQTNVIVDYTRIFKLKYQKLLLFSNTREIKDQFYSIKFIPRYEPVAKTPVVERFLLNCAILV